MTDGKTTTTATASGTQVLKAMLEDRRGEIQDKLRSLRETLPAEVGTRCKDAEEQSVDDFVQEVDLALMEMKSETLRKIDEAMQRLEDGHATASAPSAATEIAEARLKALPFAALCRDCQEQAEDQARRARGEGLRAAAEGARDASRCAPARATEG